MAKKPIKPTKTQLAEAKVRAAASGISMNQSAKGLRNAGKAIIAGASMLPAGRAVKAATTASRIAKTAATKNSARKNSNMVGRVANKNLKDYQQHDIKNWTPSKPSVKVKPAAKQKPGKKDIKTFIAKRAVRNEKINEAQKGDDFVNSGIRPAGPFSDGKTKLIRQIKASNKKR